MHGDIQHAVEQVLAIEREADAIVDRAGAEARSLRAHSVGEAGRLRERLLADARMEAEARVARAQGEAEEERERLLAGADRQIKALEESASNRFEAAVRFIVARLLGEMQPEGPAIQETRERQG